MSTIQINGKFIEELIKVKGSLEFVWKIFNRAFFLDNKDAFPDNTNLVDPIDEGAGEMIVTKPPIASKEMSFEDLLELTKKKLCAKNRTS